MEELLAAIRIVAGPCLNGLGFVLIVGAAIYVLRTEKEPLNKIAYLLFVIVVVLLSK